MKRNSSLKCLERRLAADNKDLKFILESLLKALVLMTEAVSDMKNTMRDRLPVWGDASEEKAAPKPAKPN
jgi:hypothetical protein